MAAVFSDSDVRGAGGSQRQGQGCSPGTATHAAPALSRGALLYLPVAANEKTSLFYSFAGRTSLTLPLPMSRLYAGVLTRRWCLPLPMSWLVCGVLTRRWSLPLPMSRLVCGVLPRL